MMEFVARNRTRFSQLLGCFFLLAFMFTDRKLDNSYYILSKAMIIAGCLLIGCATVGRLWCAQYIAGYKNDVLVKWGPYSICRNPLYFFSLLGGIGVGLCTESFTLTAIIAAVFAAIYPITILSEERKLESIFGDEYSRYASGVPRFIPDISKFAEPSEYVVNPKVYRREIVDATYFAWIVGLLEFIDIFIELRMLPVFLSIY